MAPRLSWRENARHHTTLGRERGWTLRYGRLEVAHASASYDIGKFEPNGYYWWTAGNEELRIPPRFASEGLLPTLDEAKAAATEYVKRYLSRLEVAN